MATARIVIGATDTRDGQEATALADTALALATSQEVVGRACGARECTETRSTVVEAGAGRADRYVGGARALGDRRPSHEVGRDRQRPRGGDRAHAGRGGLRADPAGARPDRRRQIAAVTTRIADIERAAARSGGPPRERGRARARARAGDGAAEQPGRPATAVGRRRLTAAVRPRVIDASSTAGILVPAALMTRLAIGAVLGLVAGCRPRRDAGVAAPHPQRSGDRSAPRRPAAGAPAPSPPGGDRHVRSLAGQLPDPRGGRRRRAVGPAGPGRALGGRLRAGSASRLPRTGGPHVVPLVLDHEGPHDEARATPCPRTSASASSR